MKLYKITADYNPSNPHKPNYYVVANTAKEAKKKFNDIVTWLTIYGCEEIKDEKEAERIQSDRRSYIVF